MKQLLKEFKKLIEETEDFPKDELRDYYLVPAKNLLKNHPGIASVLIEEESALMMVIKQIIKGGHNIRMNHLSTLAEDLIEITPELILNSQDKDKNSIIHFACKIENFSVGLLDFMMEKGTSFSLINKKGEIPLMMVSVSESLDDLKFVHNYTEKDLYNHKDMYGLTALHYAVKTKRISNIYYLLEQGSSSLIKDKKGNLPIDYLKSIGTKKNQLVEDIRKLLCAFMDKENAYKRIDKIAKK